MHQIWRIGVADEGLIGEEQYRNGTVNNFYKSPSEFMAPLKDSDSPACRNGLRLVDERTVYVKCPYRRRWNEDGNRSHVPQRGGWPPSAAGVATASPEPPVTKLRATVYQRLEQRIADACPVSGVSITSNTTR